MQPGKSRGGERVDGKLVALQLRQPAGNELLHAGNVELRVARGILTQIGGGELEQGGGGTQAVFLQMHKRAGQLDEALEKISVRAVPVDEPQIFQHFVRLVEKLAVEAVEITKIARVESAIAKRRNLRGDARALVATDDGGLVWHGTMAGALFSGGNDGIDALMDYEASGRKIQDNSCPRQSEFSGNSKTAGNRKISEATTILERAGFSWSARRRHCYAAGVNPLSVSAFLAAIVLSLGEIIAPLSTCRAGVPVAMVVDAQTPGAKIPADFLGLSFEMQRVLADTNGNHYFTATNRPLIATFQTLGIKNLRVGGNTADRPTLPVPTETDVDNLFAFAKAADVKVIYTLRLNRGEMAAAVNMANYITKKYKTELDCFAIGNEPNVFSTNYAVYIAEWKRFAAAITAPTNSPGAKFCGPSVSPGHEKWSAQFANDLAASGQLKFISQHDYPGGDARKFATNAIGARDTILSADMAKHYAKFAANFVPDVISNGLTFRFEEANSLYDGGALDASDTFASALWALNYQWWWANHGISGINFHTGDKVAARDENKPCRYATFWTTTNGCNIHPIGYAEKMFSLGSRGKMLPVKFSSNLTNLNVTAYAIIGDDKNYYLTLINQNHGATTTNLTVSILVRNIDGRKHGQIIRLTAPAGDAAAKTGVTLGGAEISDDAKWNGQWQDLYVPYEKLGFTFTVDLPTASAAVVKLTPR